MHFLEAQDVWTCKRRGEGVHESKNKKGGGDGKMLRVDTIGRGKEKVYKRRRRTRRMVKKETEEKR